MTHGRTAGSHSRRCQRRAPQPTSVTAPTARRPSRRRSPRARASDPPAICRPRSREEEGKHKKKKRRRRPTRGSNGATAGGRTMVDRRTSEEMGMTMSGRSNDTLAGGSALLLALLALALPSPPCPGLPRRRREKKSKNNSGSRSSRWNQAIPRPAAIPTSTSSRLGQRRHLLRVRRRTDPADPAAAQGSHSDRVHRRSPRDPEMHR